MHLFHLGYVPWLDSQLVYHAQPRVGIEGLNILAPSEPYVCIGYHQDLEQEVDVAFCRERGIPVFRREVGGGAVFLDGNQIFYQVVLHQDHPLAQGDKATLYRRWPNKEALFYFLAGQLTDTFEPIDTGDLRKDLYSVFEPAVEQAYRGPVATLMPTFVAEAARDPQIRAFVSELTEDRRVGAIHALQRARRRGELRRGVDLDAVVDMINGAFACRFLLRGQPVTEKFVRKVVDLAIDGIEKP